jgi:hypothetical protein
VVGELVADEVAASYLDVWGNEKSIEPEVRRVLLEAMGPRRRARKVRLATGRCYQPKLLEERRLWGFMAQLYGLRSERNWGIGDFTDLSNLIEITAGLGGALVGVNPLHATQGSPYSPSSRHALNFLYIDVEIVPGYEPSVKLRRRLQALRESDLVDYAAVRRVKLQVLELLFGISKPRVKVRTKGLRDYAVFETLREEFGDGWQNWPEAFHRPESQAVKAFARKNANRVAFHAWLQAIAREQLDGALRHAHELGMPLGVYVDLALGADRGGAEVWSDQDAYAVGAGLGFAAVFAARAARDSVPAVHRAASRKHAARRCAAHGPRHGAVAAVVDTAGRETRPRRLCRVPVPRAARDPRRGKPARAMPGDRRGPRHGPGRAAHRA